MKAVFQILATCFFGSTSLLAGEISFVAESGEVVIQGIAQDKVARDANNLVAVGFFVAEADFDSFINHSAWRPGARVITAQERDAIEAFMDTSGFTSAEAIAKPAQDSSFSALFKGELSAGGAGFHPVMVITGGNGDADYFGVVTSGSKTLDFGSPPIGFNTDSSWDTTLAGVSGSLELARVVTDSNDNGIDDAWETANLGRLLGEAELVDETGLPYFFSYLHGSDLNDPSDRFRLAVERTPGGEQTYSWEVREAFTLGIHYDIHISTDLSDWDPLPADHYTLQQIPAAADRIRLELSMTHDYGDQAFLRLFRME